ncbi:class I SAM-dependent methyltransferase [Pseudomonas sp. NPDC088368]|uniref:class I SAM-dependent methyltransferase n=1 Tax=Pseudomonas sp. NPDC088368 TaxID=3364453 RepID=UPI003824F270
MSSGINSVRDHYQGTAEQGGHIDRVKEMLAKFGEGTISSEQLAGLDQFHSGGLKTTADFIRLLNVRPGMTVLDAGSGLGGPSRYVAENFGCQVTGVDLTESFVEIAGLLAGRTRLGERVTYKVGDLCSLPFEAKQFDVAYTQHVVMNIPDRRSAYSEINRVLKPEGEFGFFDVLATDAKPTPHYPVPWAEAENQSFLLTEPETRTVLQATGFVVQSWADVTEEVIEWFETVRLPSMEKENVSPTLKLVMGNRFGQMAENFARNLKEGKLRLVMGVCTKTNNDA